MTRVLTEFETENTERSPRRGRRVSHDPQVEGEFGPSVGSEKKTDGFFAVRSRWKQQPHGVPPVGMPIPIHFECVFTRELSPTKHGLSHVPFNPKRFPSAAALARCARGADMTTRKR